MVAPQVFAFALAPRCVSVECSRVFLGVPFRAAVEGLITAPPCCTVCTLLLPALPSFLFWDSQSPNPWTAKEWRKRFVGTASFNPRYSLHHSYPLQSGQFPPATVRRSRSMRILLQVCTPSPGSPLILASAPHPDIAAPSSVPRPNGRERGSVRQGSAGRPEALATRAEIRLIVGEKKGGDRQQNIKENFPLTRLNVLARCLESKDARVRVHAVC